MTYEVTVEIDVDPLTKDLQLVVVAAVDAPDQQTANQWRKKIEDFIGVLTGGLTTVAGSHANEQTVRAARNVS